MIAHNKEQNENMAGMRRAPATRTAIACRTRSSRHDFEKCNLLLPMAFPEGSPMHPAYGAGHATVAGGCVTMLKAFFEMFDDCDSGKERELCDKGRQADRLCAQRDGSQLVQDKKFKDKLTIQGELDKLAANISIGRNMAGVHYYSDYYDVSEWASGSRRHPAGAGADLWRCDGDDVQELRRRSHHDLRRGRQLPVPVGHRTVTAARRAARLVAAPCQRPGVLRRPLMPTP